MVCECEKAPFERQQSFDVRQNYSKTDGANVWSTKHK